MTDTQPRTFTFDHAIGADRRLRAIDSLVRTLVALAPTDGRPMCHGCLWEQIVKPLTRPVLGWERAAPHEDCHDPDDPRFKVMTGAELLAEADVAEARTPEPINDLERWLRTSHAYDTVTDVWLSILDAADPATGHGLPR